MADHTNYLTLEQVDADGEYYGVKIACIGEDGDMGEAVFTHDRRRAVAAARRHYRTTHLERATAIAVGAPKWWRMAINCGCGDECPCPRDENDRADHECDIYGLPPCTEDGFSWCGLECPADDPNAVPVLAVEVSL